MTPENLELAHTLLKKYRYLQTVAQNFTTCTGYRLMLRMEFKNAEYIDGSPHCPDLPVTKDEITDLLAELMTETYNKLKDLGVEV